MTWTRAAALDDLPLGGARSVVVEGENLLLCRVDAAQICALVDRCSHDGAAFGSRDLRGFELDCPRHGARFDVRDGSVLRAPATAPLESVAVRVADDNHVEVELESLS
ncbi:MAG: Rieske (2Fe-2S) protein [Pseudomonadota bacterium]